MIRRRNKKQKAADGKNLKRAWSANKAAHECFRREQKKKSGRKSARKSTRK